MKNPIYAAIPLLALAACADLAPSLPLPQDDLSAPAAFMQDYAPGENTADDCYAPTCGLPGAYGLPYSIAATPRPDTQRLGDPFKAIMLKMHENMPAMGGGADRDFLAGMIPHHQAAVEMADLELAHGRDADMRELAQLIRAGQAKEILQMQVLMQHHALTAGDNSAMNDYMAQMHKMHMNMPPQETGDWDADFVRNMLPHHQAAVEMAQTVLEKGRDPNVRRLALDIIGAQRMEINYMTVWLNGHQVR